MTRRPALGLGAVAVVTGLACSACSMTVDTLPLPTPGGASDTYRIEATFANALNLPTGAKVKLFGADIGEVDSMTATNYVAVVTLDIDASVLLPKGTTAELRSATPVGDVFVALSTPADTGVATPTMTDGDTIDIDSTSAGSTVEDVLGRAALLVNGGAIRDVTKIANGLGDRLGGRGENAEELLSETTRLVDSLAARQGDIDQAIQASADLSRTLVTRQGVLDEALTESGPALSVVGDNTDNIVELVSRLNGITAQLDKFPSVQGTGGRSLITDINAAAAGINAAATTPGDKLEGLNRLTPRVSKILNSQTAHVDADVARVLLGALPDPNAPGATTKYPDALDAANAVGSFTDTLMRLYAKVYGP